MFSRTSFLNVLEKATSHLQIDPDWNSIIAVSDCIRQGDVEPKFALNSIKKKLYVSNLHVNMFALMVLESCVKNCGPNFHAEIATDAFMEELHELIKGNTNVKLKEKILELIQVWAHAFRNNATYRSIGDMLTLLKSEGHKFPQLKEADAMFSASVAPTWVDGDCCNRCRVNFSLIERKHHCRNCGQVFCHRCSSKLSILPKFGIEKEVRVCDSCYDKLNTTTIKKSVTTKQQGNNSQKTHATTNNSSATPSKTEEELREEEEFQIAIALSKSEAEVNEKQKRFSNNYKFTDFEDTKDDKVKEILDPNLSKYMNRAFWEQKSLQNNKFNNEAAPSAPQQNLLKNQIPTKNETNEEFIDAKNYSQNINDDIEQFQNSLKSTIEIFVTRMNSNRNRGRPISNDSAVQSMFLNVTNMHSQLLKHLQQQDDLRSKFELLQDKLSQAKDARAALDALREEYNEKLRREAEEIELIRKQQMAYKLDIMRKKKEDYLQYQRQITLQRVQDQEREMKLRLEQQKYGVWPQNTMPQAIENVNPNLPISTQVAVNNYNPNQVYQMPVYNQMNYEQNAVLNQPQVNPNIIHHQNGNINPQMYPVTNVLPNQNQMNTMPHQPQVLPQHINIQAQALNNNPSMIQNYSSQVYPVSAFNMQGLNNALPNVNPQQIHYDQQNLQNNIQHVHENNPPQNKPQVDEAPLITFD